MLSCHASAGATGEIGGRLDDDEECGIHFWLYCSSADEGRIEVQLTCKIGDNVYTAGMQFL